jgi:hypothetical protein
MAVTMVTTCRTPWSMMLKTTERTMMMMAGVMIMTMMMTMMTTKTMMTRMTMMMTM